MQDLPDLTHLFGVKNIFSPECRDVVELRVNRLVGRRRILKICILASSSAGNSIFLGNGHTRVLIDAGLSCKEISARLEAIGERIEAIDAVLVSHEHTDHTCGLVPVLRKSSAAVHLTHLTAPVMDWGKYEPQIRCFQSGERFSVGDFEVQSFTIPHDSVDPVAFTVRCGSVKAAFVTDLGYLPESVKFHIRDCEFLLLESNHDLDMLKVGPYPWSVKQRVMGRNGHLSNSMVSDFITEGMNRTVTTLVLAHLSEQNNHPAIAELSASEALRRAAKRPNLWVSQPRVQSHVWQY